MLLLRIQLLQIDPVMLSVPTEIWVVLIPEYYLKKATQIEIFLIPRLHSSFFSHFSDYSALLQCSTDSTSAGMSAYQPSPDSETRAVHLQPLLSEQKANMQLYYSHMPMTQASLTVQPESCWVSLTGTARNWSYPAELSTKILTKMDLRSMWNQQPVQHKLPEVCYVVISKYKDQKVLQAKARISYSTFSLRKCTEDQEVQLKWRDAYAQMPSSANILGKACRRVFAYPGCVWIRTLAASMGARAMSAKNSALADAAKYSEVRHK